jgi:AcrR family transcriptional regulator
VVDVLADLGLEHTTLRTVAAAHGCTKGMVQHYYADKEALLLGALAFVEEQGENRIAGSLGQQAGLDRLQTRLQAQLPTQPERLKEWRVRLLFGIRAVSSPQMRAAIGARAACHQKEGLACLRSAGRAGELRRGVNQRNAWRTLNALVSGLGVIAVSNPDGVPAAAQRQVLQAAIDALRR